MDEVKIITDIINAQHLVIIPINDEGDFAVLPVVFNLCNPEWNDGYELKNNVLCLR